jgi:hypothetical protein
VTAITFIAPKPHRVRINNKRRLARLAARLKAKLKGRKP